MKRRRISREVVLLLIAAGLFACSIVCLVLSWQTVLIVTSVLSLLTVGWPVFSDAVRGLLRRDLLDEKFLMSLASIGALLIGEYLEAPAVMIFYQIGELFQARAVRRSRQSVRSLMQICPDTARVLRDGEVCEVDAEDVGIGELLLLRPGERVPLDVRIEQGESELDTSAISGESMPVPVRVGEEVKSGTVVLTGVLYGRALRRAEDSAAARILALVETAHENKAPEERFITRFARVYTPIVVALALVLGLVVPLFDGMRFAEYIRRALIFLVISCPCALVLSVPMAFFGGIGGAASRGILYKGGHIFSALCRIRTLALDKTGTLTTGHMRVRAVIGDPEREAELLTFAAIAEHGSNHPIACAIRAAAPRAPIPDWSEERSGRGTVCRWQDHRIAVGNRALMQEESVEFDNKYSQYDGICVFVSVDGRPEGCVILEDAPRAEARESLAAMHSLGVGRTVMLTGDRESVARAVGDAVGIDEVHARLLPEEKFAHLSSLMQTASGGRVMYVGDGINDAPSIALADVGVAMGGIGQDSAIEAADVVIVKDSLTALPMSVLIARKTVRIAKQNIVFALGVKLLVMVLGAVGYANMWLAVFADVGVAVLAILNAMRALRPPRLP